jgi:hypothetical protein
MANQEDRFNASLSNDSMVFGFDRATDEASLALFLEKIGRPELLATLVPRLEEKEIASVVDLFTGLMKKHLSKKEYHKLFLGE